MDKNSKIYLAGHSGLVGGYLLKQLYTKGYNNIIVKTSDELDLTNMEAVKTFFSASKPEYVFLVAGRTGGVAEFFKRPVEYYNINMRIEMNVLECAQKYNIRKLVFVGASCVYPESQGRIIHEDDFQTGWVQKATEPYALAKAMGLKLCQYYNQEYGTNFIAALLSNIYGLADRDHLDMTTVLPAFVRRFKDAVQNNLQQVEIWGNGNAKREFLHGSDCAQALIDVMENDESYDCINVGSGSQVSINELALMVAKATGFKGKIIHDLTKPNGSNRSVLDISRLKSLGWEPQISLEDGIKELVNKI